LEIVESLRPICALLDSGRPESSYQASLELQREKLLDPAATPSARLLDAMREREASFFEFARDLSADYRTYFLQLPPIARERLRTFEDAVETSRRSQREIEETDDVSFEEFLRRYYAA
jgi:glutamate--cysteine ligase